MNYNTLLSLANDNEKKTQIEHIYQSKNNLEDRPFLEVMQNLKKERDHFEGRLNAYKAEYKMFLDELKQRYPNAWSGMLNKKI